MNYLHVWQDVEMLLESILLGFYFISSAAQEGRQTDLLTNNSFLAPGIVKKHVLLFSPSVK